MSTSRPSIIMCASAIGTDRIITEVDRRRDARATATGIRSDLNHVTQSLQKQRAMFRSMSWPLDIYTCVCSR